jgi:hypothetical protein
MAIGMMTFISGSGSVWDSKKELENHAAMVALYFCTTTSNGCIRRSA